MGKRTKTWLVIAACLVLAGGVVFAGVMMHLDWDFTKLSTVQYETNEYHIDQSFKDILVITDIADVTFLLSEDNESKIVCYEQAKRKHAVGVEDGTLTIELQDMRQWYDYIGICFGVPKIVVYLPLGEYGALSVTTDTGDVEIPMGYFFENIRIIGHTGDVANRAPTRGEVVIETDTGDICIENITAAGLDLSVSTGAVAVTGTNCEKDIKIVVSTGKTRVTDSQCANLMSDGDTGDVYLKNVIASGEIAIERSRGDVTFDGSDATDIIAETDTGNVAGTLLSGKMFLVDSDTGRVVVPESVPGGKCQINTDTGDITIEIPNS